MKTTIQLDDQLLMAAKRHAAATQRTLAQLIHDAVVILLEKEQGAASPRKVNLPTFTGNGVFEGIDINRTSTLLDSMEVEN